MKKRAIAGLTPLLLLVGCGGAVKIARVGPVMDPRPADCIIEFLEKQPERPFVELAEITTKVVDIPAQGPALLRGATRAEVAESYLRPTACQLGAQAVIVIRAEVIGAYDQMLIAGMAIRWLVATDEMPSPAAGAETGATAP